VLQFVAVRCSVLQCVAVCSCHRHRYLCCSVLQFLAVCCGLSQCVAFDCDVLVS